MQQEAERWNVPSREKSQNESRRVNLGKQYRKTDSVCRMRPDGIAVLPPIGNNTGLICILQNKRMSDITESPFQLLYISV